MKLPDGWLTDEEATELRRLTTGKVVLELGAWKGRSTVAMAEVAEYVVSVDRHQGIAEVGGEDSLPDYLENVRGMANVAIVVADFQSFVPMLRSFDVVFVDGDHDERSVYRDTLLAVAHCHGVVCFHDWDFDSVRAGVKAVLHRSPNTVVGSLAAFTL